MKSSLTQNMISNPPKLNNMSNDLAYFLGLICGDGYVGRNNNIIEIKSECFEFLSEVYVPIVVKLFSKKPSIKPESGVNKAFRAYTSSKLLSNFLKKIGIVSPKTYIVHMPSLIKKLEHQVCFVRGIMDTDGSITLRLHKKVLNYPIIKVECKSKLLIDDVTKTLLKVGLNPKQIKFKKRNGYMHSVALYGFKQSKLFYEKIGFLHPKKKLRLENLVKDGIKRLGS